MKDDIFSKEFVGTWDGYNPAAVNTEVQREIRVKVPGAFPQAVYMQAGCKDAYVHYTTAVPMALAMLEAAFAAGQHEKKNDPIPVLCITSKKSGRTYFEPNVLTIDARGNKVAIINARGNERIVRAEGYNFSFRIHNPSEEMKKMIEALGTVLASAPSLTMNTEPLPEEA